MVVELLCHALHDPDEISWLFAWSVIVGKETKRGMIENRWPKKGRQ
jgi:hypothetical protein